jgi:hypothetical protein
MKTKKSKDKPSRRRETLLDKVLIQEAGERASQNAPQSRQDAPGYVLIDDMAAMYRFFLNEPTEALIPQYGTDKVGAWEPFQLSMLYFPMKPLKFRRPA